MYQHPSRVCSPPGILQSSAPALEGFATMIINPDQQPAVHVSILPSPHSCFYEFKSGRPGQYVRNMCFLSRTEVLLFKLRLHPDGYSLHLSPSPVTESGPPPALPAAKNKSIRFSVLLTCASSGSLGQVASAGREGRSGAQNGHQESDPEHPWLRRCVSCQATGKPHRIQGRGAKYILKHTCVKTGQQQDDFAHHTHFSLPRLVGNSSTFRPGGRIADFSALEPPRPLWFCFFLMLF
jgi:hypothetical protein